MLFQSLVFASALLLSEGFQSQTRAFSSRSVSLSSPSTFQSSPLFHAKKNHRNLAFEQSPSLLQKVMRRFDTIESAGLEDARISGIVGKFHGPITYLALGLMAGLKYRWCFRNPYYWFAMAFCVKWYRARYVFKIPVWDRQPNWNNIITSKEQEKDLKAFTCKKCGSTIFIAKTREFFFEGDTGIGGLGCFSCGAKGKENFIMDRDRIVEDVSDMDDYFEYERPLDFVSAAERRKLMKETDGDEEKANQILLERSNEEEGVTAETEQTESSGDTEKVDDTEMVEETDAEDVESEEVEEVVEEVQESVEEEEPVPEAPKAEAEKAPVPKAEKKSPPKKAPKKAESLPDDFDLDDLDMDNF